jgi:hypothetical protein
VGSFNRAESSEQAIVGAITGAEFGKFKPQE